MYYPYLRGKQFELILLRDNAKLLGEAGIHPVIEPVKADYKGLSKALEALNKNGVGFTLIANPKVGNVDDNLSEILKHLSKTNNDHLSLGYILDANSDLNDLSNYLNKYNEYPFSIIHAGYTDGKEVLSHIEAFSNINRHIFIDGQTGKLYQRHFKNGVTRILIRDGFKTQSKNALYPDFEHFSDLHITYPDEGMNGFGDYLIVGDNYTETGGPAYAVAIHLTYTDADEDMFIYHFKSDQTDSPTDPGGKFLEALEKLIQEYRKPDSSIFKSEACKEYDHLYQQQHYPGLGYVKKLSMQHHIELMADFIKRQ